MIVKVQHAREWVDIHVDGDEATVAALCAQIEHQIDVPVNKQKLICKGKVLDAGKTLCSYGIKESSKLLLMASTTATQGQLIARELAEKRRVSAAARHHAVKLHAAGAAASASGRHAPASLRDINAERKQKWRDTGIVSLRGMGLPEISAEAGQFCDLGPNVYAVDVGNNELRSLPDIFLSMQGMQRFRCSHNSLTAEGLPWTTLSLLPKLNHLLLDNNLLGAINPVICQATTLRVLHLHNNALRELPDDIGNLVHLEELQLDNNRIERLPHTLGACLRLKWLQAVSNKISSIPESLSGLASLRGLVLDDNRVTAVPANVLRMCTELHTVSLRDNPLTMQQLREADGFAEFSKRRKGRLDKLIDAHIGANFEEAADYDRS